MNKPTVTPILVRSRPEVIKLEYSLKLKIKRNDWLLGDTSRYECSCLIEFI